MGIGAATLTGLLMVCASGCGSPQPSHSGIDPDSSSASAMDSRQVRTTSLKYLASTFNGDYREAAKYVAPSSRGILEAIALSAPKERISSTNLQLGSVTIQGNAATVKFTGKVCQRAASSSAKKCIANHDKNTSRPAFAIHLARLDGKWFVVFGASERGASGAVGGSSPN